MATNTTLLTVEDKLVELFDAATSRPVTYAWPGPSAQSSCVFLGVHPDAQDILLDLTSEDPVIKAGRRQSQEEYELTVTIWEFRPDLTADGARTCAAAAHAVYDDLYDVLVDDTHIGLGSTILWARPAGFQRRLYPFQKGWACDLRMQVDVSARVT